MKIISSRDNAVFKRLRSLADDARSRKIEQSSLIDGEHLLVAAIEANWPIKQIIFRDDIADSSLAKRLLQSFSSVQNTPGVLVLSHALFKQVSPVVSPTGVLAEIDTGYPAVCSEHKGMDVLALAGVQDAGNLGTLLRTAVACGVPEVWLDEKCTQAWSPKALRAGMGAQFRLRIRENCDLKALIETDNRCLLVTALASDSASLYALDLRNPVIWLFGSEGQGVPTDLLKMADVSVQIPMTGNIESLNVGAAAAVCLFEQYRQRKA